METTYESFHTILSQYNWKCDGDRLQLFLSDDTETITPNLSNVISESGQRLLGLTYKHGFARKSEEGIILLNYGIATIPIDATTFIYPIWGSEYFPNDDEITILEIPYRGERGVIEMVEYNVGTPYGNVPIYTKNTGEIIQARQLEPYVYNQLFNVKIFPVSMKPLKYNELPLHLQEEIKTRICL
jgi:hypothetical protein